MIAKMVNINARKMQTLKSPGIELIKVCITMRMLFSCVMERNGRNILAVRNTLRLFGSIPGVKATRLTKTMKKSIQFHLSRK